MNAVTLPEIDVEGAAPAAAPAPAPGVSVISPTAGMVAVTKPTGEVVLMHQEDALAGANGVRPATEAEYFGAAHPYSSKASTAALGFARGLSFGVSDPAIVEAGRLLGGDADAEDMRRMLRINKEANPNTNLGFELGGAVAPAFFGAPPVRAGGALGEGLLARGAARAAAAAPRAIGEGVAIGLGNQLSEDTIQNHRYASEAYVSAGLKGGTIGLITGALGAAGIGAAGDKLGQLFGRGEGAALRAEESAATRLGSAEEHAAEKGPASKWLEQAEDIQSFKGATNAKTGDIRRLGIDVEAQEGVEARLGKLLREEKLTGPLVTQAESAKRITAKMQEVGSTIRPIHVALDKTGIRPEMAGIVSRFEETVAGPRLESIMGEAELKPAQDFLTRMVEKDGESPSFEKLWGRRRELDKMLSAKGEYARVPGMPAKPGAEDLRALKDLLNGEIGAAAEKASPELAQKLRLANAMYSDLAVVNKIATHQASLNAASNMVSITDVIGASTGGLAGFAMAGANMVRRKFGNQLAAHVLGTVSKMETIQRAASKLDDMLSSGTKAFVSGSKSVPTREIKYVTTADIRALREATRNPEAVTARVAEHLGDMPKYAPKTAGEIAAGAARAATWLQFALPKESPPVSAFTKSKLPPLSDTQLMEARATIETVEDGSIVVDRLRQGRLTPEHVAALKYVHPETYAKIQKYLGDHTTELNATMTQQQLFSLSMLFGQPLTEAALPENVRAFQASFSQGNQAPGAGGTGGGISAPKMGAGPVKGGGTSAMGADRLEAGSK